MQFRFIALFLLSKVKMKTNNGKNKCFTALQNYCVLAVWSRLMLKICTENATPSMIN